MVAGKKRKKTRISILLLFVLTFLGIGCTIHEVKAKELPKNPVYNEDTEAGTWDYVFFGRYPQTEVKGDDLTKSIIKALYNDNGDAIVDDVKYRRVEDENGDYKYFRYEPIKWRVLKNDGNSLLLLADKMLCHGELSGHSVTGDYKSSVYRSILNGYDKSKNKRHFDYSGTDQSFYDMAFYEEEKEIMEAQLVTGCNSTDYVIIPSWNILSDSNYGFGSDYSRLMESTAYADEGDFAAFACCYEDEGYIWGLDYQFGHDWGTINDDQYIVPMIKINIDSNLWSMECPETNYVAKGITLANVKLSETSFVYDGKAKKPKVTVSDDGRKLVENIDYKITYKNNKNAGTAIVEIRGLGQYDGTKKVTFEIKKKEQEFSVKKEFLKNVGDKKFKLDVVRVAGNGTYKYKSSNPKVVKVNKYGTVTIVGGGDAIITITAEETNDYEKKSVDVKVSVKYKIKYYLNKGKNDSENPSSYFNQNITLKNPTRKGYVFKGWYTDKNFEKKITKITTKTKKNLNLYAKWKKVNVEKAEITTLKNLKGKKIQLKFDKIKNIDGYQIVYSTDVTFDKNKKTIYTKDNKVTLKSLKKNKTYYVKVRAYCVDSTGRKIYGTYSDVESVKIRK